MRKERDRTRHSRFERAVWTQYAIIALGAWLVASPITFGYQSDAVLWSDVASGILAMVLAALAVSGKWPSVRWGIVAVGLWLLLAPLLFSAPTAVAYTTDTLVGTLLVLLAVIVPGPPGEVAPGPVTPPGWSYNPASWPQRGPVVALGLIGFFISRYLAAYQLGHIDWAWDPFFGSGTERILESDVSRAFPVSDAGLGALSYMLDALAGAVGTSRRWRTMPWVVVLFGILVIPLGAVSITLVILRPVAVGAWCTLCLVTAMVMLPMIPLAADEVVATWQFLARDVRRGGSLWRTLWRGGAAAGAHAAGAGAVIGDGVAADTTVTRGTRGEASGGGGKHADAAVGTVLPVPWSLALSAVVGVGVMALPGLLGLGGGAADSAHVAGALVAAIAVVSMGEV